jgi:CheY-like chemotaxis protein
MHSVLVVDDDPLCRYTYRRVLENAGYNVRVAGNGKEALSLQRWYPSDLVVSDIVMPEVDGLAMIPALRKDFPELPVIVYTGRAPQFIAEALRLGASVAITKPFPIFSLVETVSSILARR